MIYIYIYIYIYVCVHINTNIFPNKFEKTISKIIDKTLTGISWILKQNIVRKQNHRHTKLQKQQLR